MKFSAQEEYALRCLIRIGKKYNIDAVTISEISDEEGIPQHTIAKILRELRLAGFLESERGHTGGYSLTKNPKEIKISDVFLSIGSRLFDDEFCKTHSGITDICTNSVDCSIKSLWGLIQDAVDNVTDNITLENLINNN